MSPREPLIQSFHAAVAAVGADRLLPPHLPTPPKGRTLVLGAGKAAADMVACIERHWPEAAPLDGLVITRHGHGLPTRRIRVAEAGHPLPDAAGLAATAEVLRLAQEADADDLILAPISGGGSSLLTLPSAGLELADLAATSRALLHSGAPIREINIVRKHLCRTLGGRLAAASRARVECFLLSDVAGDDPASIASGPFVADPSTFAEALEILARWRIDAPTAVVRHLREGAEGRIAETPKPGDARLSRVNARVIGGGRTALAAAADYFKELGIPAVILGDTFSGEARELAKAFAALAREVRLHGSPWRPPLALLSGGETEVRVQGTGKGGRNTEFLLSLAIELDGLAGVHALAADTDGIDGSEDNAGAVIDPSSLIRARDMRLDPADHLARNDAYAFFSALGDLLVTGPTRTNVNDYRALLIT